MKDDLSGTGKFAEKEEAPNGEKHRFGDIEVGTMSASRAPLTLLEAATYLNVSERYMRRLVAERRIAYHKVGRLLRFCQADLDGLLQASRVEPPPQHPLLQRR